MDDTEAVMMSDYEDDSDFVVVRRTKLGRGAPAPAAPTAPATAVVIPINQNVTIDSENEDAFYCSNRLLVEERTALLGRPGRRGGIYRDANDPRMRIRPLDWILEPFMLRRQTVMFYGAPATGKSKVSMDMLAKLTAGKPLPGQNTGLPAHTVGIICNEMHFADQILPLLIAAGADLNRVKNLPGVASVTRNAADARIEPWLFPEHLSDLKTLVRELTLDVVYIDPLSAVFGNGNANDGVAARRFMAAFQDLAEETNTAIIFVHHTKKGNSDQLCDRLAGSGQFSATIRCVSFIGDDYEDPSGDTKVLLPVKNNLSAIATGYRFKIVTKTVKRDGQTIPTTGIEWLDDTAYTQREYDEWLAHRQATQFKPAVERGTLTAQIRDILASSKYALRSKGILHYGGDGMKSVSVKRLCAKLSLLAGKDQLRVMGEGYGRFYGLMEAEYKLERCTECRQAPFDSNCPACNGSGKVWRRSGFEPVKR